MSDFNLTAISPIDGRYANKVDHYRLIFSEYGLIRHRVLIEIRWLQALASNPQISEIEPFDLSTEAFLKNITNNFTLNDALRVKEIEKTTNHDVKAIEYFLKGIFSQHANLAKISEFIHFGCTSEDINNLAYALMLREGNILLLNEINDCLAVLKDLIEESASCPMLSRTHGQPATPTTVGKEIANFYARLNRQKCQLEETKFFGKMNGAVGNHNAHCVTYPDIDWLDFTKYFVSSLGLTWNPFTTQIEPHDFISEYFHNIIRHNSILIDFNRDMWGYISLNYFSQKNVPGEIGSSTMPHKINPIDFENSEGNLAIANALLSFIAEKLTISRWQRDLTDSTVLRNIGVGIAHTSISIQSSIKGTLKLKINNDTLNKDLENNLEILAEPIQTIMRRYGVEQPYEKLKELTRGNTITQQQLTNFINNLNIPEDVKLMLRQLSPNRYIGYAEKLAKSVSSFS